VFLCGSNGFIDIKTTIASRWQGNNLRVSLHFFTVEIICLMNCAFFSVGTADARRARFSLRAPTMANSTWTMGMLGKRRISCFIFIAFRGRTTAAPPEGTTSAGNTSGEALCTF
jgi:hypothetical protein